MDVLAGDYARPVAVTLTESIKFELKSLKMTIRNFNNSTFALGKHWMPLILSLGRDACPRVPGLSIKSDYT